MFVVLFHLFFDYLYQRLQRQLPRVLSTLTLRCFQSMALVGKYWVVVLVVTVEAIDFLHNYNDQLRRKQ